MPILTALRSTRLRVALTSALASAVALGAVSVWFVAQSQSRLENSAAQLARSRAVAIVQLLGSGARPADLRLLVRDSIYEVDERDGAPVASCPVLWNAYLATGAEPDVDGVRILQPYEVVRSEAATVPCASQLAPNTDDPLRLHVVLLISGDSRYRVHGAASVNEGDQQAVDAVRTTLLAGVPAVALLIGVIAWFAVRRSLRPVEAIRAEVAEIGAHDLSRRVPAPGSGDEVARLAGTMNTMLARLDAAVTRQSRFTADASHELRTPLASLRTQLEVLLTHPDRIDWRTTCENTLLDVMRLQDVVADLVLLGKLDAAPEEYAPVSLSEVVSSCLDGRVARESVTTRAETADVVVTGHRSRLERLVRNLVDNAERHARSSVVVEVSTVDGAAVLSVTDDGPGIPAEDRERVFDRFVRLDDGRDRDEGGSGLGLAIVADIARAHGGTAEVADHDGGARFVVRIPIRS